MLAFNVVKLIRIRLRKMNLLGVFSVFVVFGNCWCKINRNNVCKNWEDYDTISNNPNCWHNPNVFSNTEDIVQRNGYTITPYQIETSDGYRIQFFRIGKKESDPQDKQPVFLQHGMATESTFWVAISNRSLALTLVDNDYDVWLGNIRGNRYGRNHTKFSTDDKKFWDYSIDDIGLIDIPAMLDVVSKETNQKIIYIGHSMGTTGAFMFASDMKNEADKKLLAIIAVSPSAYLKDMTYLRYIIPLLYPVSVNLEKTISSLNINTLTASPEISNMLASYCLGSSQHVRICLSVIDIMFGPCEGQLLPEDLPILLSYANSGTAFKCLTHYMQMSGSKKFQHYDFGEVKNQRMYGNTKPSSYNLSDIDIPVHLFSGANDALTTYKNVHKLYKDLKTKDKSLTMLSEGGESVNFNHIDFIIGKDNMELFIKPVLHLLNEKLLNNKIK